MKKKNHTTETPQEIQARIDESLEKIFGTKNGAALGIWSFENFFRLFEKCCTKKKGFIRKLPEFKNWVTVWVTLVENHDMQYNKCNLDTIKMLIEKCSLEFNPREIKGVRLQRKLEALNKIIYNYWVIPGRAKMKNFGPAWPANRKIDMWQNPTEND